MKLHPIDWVCVALYLVGMAAMGLYFARRNTGTEEYFVGGRRFPGWAIGLSMVGTAISSITFLSLPADAFKTYWLRFLPYAFMPVAAALSAWLFIPFFRRGEAMTAYEYLEARFGPSIRIYGAATYIAAQLLRVSFILYLVALMLNSLTGVDETLCILVAGAFVAVYTIVGGIDAVIWTDVIQTVVLIAGSFFCLGTIVVLMPEGLGQVFEIAQAHDKFALGDLTDGRLVRTDWSLDFSRKTIPLMLLMSFNFFLTDFATGQHYIQRYCSAASMQEARRAMWTNVLVGVPTWFFYMFLGTALFAFFQVFPEPEAAAMLDGTNQARRHRALLRPELSPTRGGRDRGRRRPRRRHVVARLEHQRDLDGLDRGRLSPPSRHGCQRPPLPARRLGRRRTGFGRDARRRRLDARGRGAEPAGHLDPPDGAARRWPARNLSGRILHAHGGCPQHLVRDRGDGRLHALDDRLPAPAHPGALRSLLCSDLREPVDVRDRFRGRAALPTARAPRARALDLAPMTRPAPIRRSSSDSEGPDASRTRSRTTAGTSMAIFCAVTVLFLAYRDLALPHVGQVEIWFGIELHGVWARWTAPLHWAIFAGAALAFWRAWSPIWPLSIGYSVYIAVSHLIWNLTSVAGGGLGSGLAQALLFLVPTAILMRLRPRPARRGVAAPRGEAPPSQAG